MLGMAAADKAKAIDAVAEFPDILCDVCWKPSKTRCSRCKDAVYCSVACQRQAWPQHKLACQPPPSDDTPPEKGGPRVFPPIATRPAPLAELFAAVDSVARQM
jgi:hypothetical protein